MADADCHGFGARGGAKFAKNRSDVEFGGVVGDDEPRGDFLVSKSRGKQLEDFAFAFGERFDKRRDLCGR